MKKFLLAIVGAAFLALSPVAASAAECYPIETAKADVATWATAAEWSYVKDGPEFNALMKWYTVQGVMIDKIDGLSIVKTTGSDGKTEMVYFAQSPDGTCVDMSTTAHVSRTQYELILGQEI